jgi:hypothetical protein
MGEDDVTPHLGLPKVNMEETTKVKVSVLGADPDLREAVIAALDEEMGRFNKFMVEEGKAHALTRAEMAIVKTYLLYKHQKAF